MRILMLLRHAKAIPQDAKMRDIDRPLDSRGQKDAPKIGAYLARHRLAPDSAIVSPAHRTRETWALLSPAFKIQPEAVFDDRLYDASPQTMLDLIQQTGGAAQKLLLVAHNPTIHRVALGLIASGDVEAREELREGLPTSGLVTIEFAFDDWQKLHLQAGRLTHFVTPRSLEAATD